MAKAPRPLIVVNIMAWQVTWAITSLTRHLIVKMPWRKSVGARLKAPLGWKQCLWGPILLTRFVGRSSLIARLLLGLLGPHCLHNGMWKKLPISWLCIGTAALLMELTKWSRSHERGSSSLVLMWQDKAFMHSECSALCQMTEQKKAKKLWLDHKQELVLVTLWSWRLKKCPS